MFGFAAAMAIAEVQLAQQMAENERKFVQNMKAIIPEMEWAAWLKEHNEQLDKRRLERLATSRHNEMVRAIERSRPSGIGIFW